MATDPASIIAAQQAYANGWASDAGVFLSKLDDLSDSFFSAQSNARVDAPPFEFTEAELQSLLLSLFPDELVVADISGVQPSFTPDTVAPLEAVPVPDFGKVAPVLSMPAAPSAALPTAPAAPAINDPVLPSAPIITLPTPVVVTGIALPEPPSVEIPAFTTTLPVDDLVVPTNSFTFFEELYSSALLDELKEKLLDNLQNGGYGIELSDEAGLWDRARSRELEAAMVEAEALITEAAGRGFPLPPGDLNVALQRANQNLQAKMSGINRDIALKRADMYVDNRKFTIEQTKQLEQILIGYHNSVMERALNAAKAVLDAAIKIYDAQVARFNARLEAYKSEAAVFEARVRAAMAQVEIYRAQMQGKQIEAEIQRIQVEVYNAQLNGLNTVVNLYKTQMEAAQVQAGIERLRIEAFKALIEAYTSQVQAKVAEFNMFESQIKGEVAKMNAYESEVKAYVATVDGAKAKADILIARLRGDIDLADQKIKVYQTQAEVYKTDIGAQAQTIDAKVRVYGGKVQGAAAKAQAVSEIHRLGMTKSEIELKARVENARVAIEDAKTFLQGMIASAEVRTRSGVAAAGYYQALIGAAVNSINTLSALVAQS